MPDESPVLLKLSCVNRIVSGSGKDRSVRERVVWQEEQTVAREGLEPGPEGAVVPVSFQLPLDAPPTRSDNSDDRILWRLQARARLAGVDYDEQFEVPVAAAPSGTTPAADPQAVAPAERPESSRIVVEPDPAGGTRFLLPAARNAGAKLVSIFYACLFSGFAALFMILARTQVRGILAGFIPWVLGIILVPFALVMVLVALHTCLLSTSVTVSSTGVAVKSRVKPRRHRR